MKCLTVRISAALLAVVLTSVAFATNDQHPQEQIQTQQSLADSTSISLAGSRSDSAASSQSGAHSGAISGASSNSSGGQSSSTSAGGLSVATQSQQANGGQSTSALSNSGNSSAAVTGTVVDASNVTVGGDTYEAARIPVATALATAGQTTASCHYGNGGAGQGTAFGLSLTFSRKDKDCERFLLAQFLYDRGQDFAGDRLMCRIGSVAEALGEDCLALVHEIRVSRPDPRVLKREEFNRTQGFAK
jgi:hypothetical protein